MAVVVCSVIWCAMEFFDDGWMDQSIESGRVN